MSDFFGTLEAELREAALRPPRRAPDVRPLMAAGAAAAMSLVAIAVALVFVVDRGPGPAQVREADPQLPPLVNPQVVAEGEAPIAGRWRLVSYESERLEVPETGEVSQPAGLRCLGIQRLDGNAVTRGGFSGQCGEFAQTPGFGRMQHTVSDSANGPQEILVYGRTPEEAAAVRIRRWASPDRSHDLRGPLRRGRRLLPGRRAARHRRGPGQLARRTGQRRKPGPGPDAAVAAGQAPTGCQAVFSSVTASRRPRASRTASS